MNEQSDCLLGQLDGIVRISDSEASVKKEKSEADFVMQLC